MTTFITPPNARSAPFHLAQSRLSVDVTQLTVAQRYAYLIEAISPRPIALVATTSDAGARNLAPFSSFSLVSSNPACLSFCVAPNRDGSIKDTLANITQSQEFVVNSVHPWMIRQTAGCGESLAHGVDEGLVNNLSYAPASVVKACRVLESIVNWECRLEKFVPIGDGSPGSATIVIGRIIMLHIAKHAIKAGKIDALAYAPVSRLGGRWYSTLGDLFQL